MRLATGALMLWRPRAGVLGAVMAVAMVVAIQIDASAAVSPYLKGTLGYDYSYVQCGKSAPRLSFGIIGVTAGYPFTFYNNCLSTEYVAATKTGNAALYVNTGYDPSYTAVDGRHSTQDCVNRSAAISGTPAQTAAWAVGCSEAQRDLASFAAIHSVTSPTAWWLDVETANSWSTSDLSLNVYTLRGLIETLRGATSAPLGVYSTPYQWGVITGGYQAPVDANWVATGTTSLKRARTFCTGSSFTGAPVWLVQYVATYDHDYVC
jgi:hypothetical protein